MKLESISVEAKGNARLTPILFIHGAWHGAWCWKENFMPYFAQNGYNTYALSLRGHGNSEGSKHIRWTSIADYLSDVSQVVSQLPKVPVLVGHSMGGFIVQKYLETNKAPAGVLLASIPTHGAFLCSLKFAKINPIGYIKTNLTMSLYPLVAKLEHVQKCFFSEDISSEKLNEYHKLLVDESYRMFLDILLLNLPKPKKVTTDMLVLGAEKDNVIGVDEVKQTAQAYNTKAEIFPDMAHDMMLEKGWKSVADCIINWLKEKNL